MEGKKKKKYSDHKKKFRIKINARKNVKGEEWKIYQTTKTNINSTLKYNIGNNINISSIKSNEINFKHKNKNRKRKKINERYFDS